MRKLLSYAKSHIYDIHAVLTGTIVFILMQYIKKPIKKYLEDYVEHLLEKNPHLLPKRSLYIKRCNMILIILTMLLSFVLFGLIAFISPMIHFSFQSAVMSGVYALFEYAIVEQIVRQ